MALTELKAAVRLAPERYTPFDLHEYDPQEILGHGGFGVTVQCREVNAERDVAIKILLQDDLDRKIEDVIQEGRILAKLPHKNVVELRAVRYADPARKARPYFVMEYLKGFTTLAEYVQKNGPLEPYDMVEIATQIAEGLKAAHDKGVFHRDVKPANVMVRREESQEADDRRWSVKIIDFGLAVRRDLADAGYSTSGTAQARTTIGVEVAGTINYAAPEQMDMDFQRELLQKPPEEQRAVHVRSDIYGFGKTCIFALCGDTNFEWDEAERLFNWRKLLGNCTKRAVEKRTRDFAEVLKVLAADEVLALARLPEGAIEYTVESETAPALDDDPPPAPNEQTGFNWEPLQVAGASLVPGVGHLLLGQRAKGAALLAITGLLIVPAFACLYPTMIAVWVIVIAFDAFDTAMKLRRDGGVHPWSVFGFPPGELTRRLLVVFGVGFLVVWASTHFIVGWLTKDRAVPADSTVNTAAPDPRFLGEWTKPDDEGGLDKWRGKAKYGATVTPTSINWTYVETAGLGPKTYDKSSRYRWVKSNEIHLLDVEGRLESRESIKRRPVTVRLDFVSDGEVIVTTENVGGFGDFAEFQGKFQRKK